MHQIKAEKITIEQKAFLRNKVAGIEKARELERMEINAMKTGDPIKLALYDKLAKTGPKVLRPGH